jgi:hypothetical protein
MWRVVVDHTYFGSGGIPVFFRLFRPVVVFIRCSDFILILMTAVSEMSISLFNTGIDSIK